MKTETELMVSVAGVQLSFFELLRKKLERVGRGFEVIRYLVTPEGEVTMDKIVALLVDAVPLLVGTLKCLVSFRPTVSKTGRVKVADYLKVGINQIVYCDSSVRQLGEFALAVDGGQSKVFELTEQGGTQFREIAALITGETGPDEKRKQSLVVQNRVYSPAQVGELLGKARKVEGRVDCPVTGLLTNGWANIFFVDRGDGSVLVLDASWFVGGWCVVVLGFGGDFRWCAGFRVFLRN